MVDSKLPQVVVPSLRKLLCDSTISDSVFLHNLPEEQQLFLSLHFFKVDEICEEWLQRLALQNDNFWSGEHRRFGGEGADRCDP